MEKIKLVALDLDGTTLNHQKKLSAETVEAIRRVQAAGVHVVFDTGRPWVSTVAFLEELEMLNAQNYAICLNGGLVTRGDGQIISKKRLTYAEVMQVYTVAKKLDLPMDIISEEISFTVAFGRQSKVHFINNTLIFKPISVEALPAERYFNKIILSAESDVLDAVLSALTEALSANFEIFRTRDILLELMPKGVDKGWGLATLCATLAIQADNVLAIGDEANDIPMLKWAGLGIAPANASLSVKEAADKVSDLSNNEGAVAAALKEFVRI